MAKIKLTATQKKLSIGFAAVVLLIALGMVVWMKLIPTNDSDTEEDVPAEISLNRIGSQAASYIASGEVEKAFAYYDEQIERTQDNREKKSLLIKKAITATDMELYDEAIASAKQADEIESDTATMRALADAYAANGDKEEALTYYKKLLALKKPAPDTEGARSGMELDQSVENIIKELEQ